MSTSENLQYIIILLKYAFVIMHFIKIWIIIL